LWYQKLRFLNKVINNLKKTCAIDNCVLYLHQVYNWLVKGLHPPRLEAFFFLKHPLAFLGSYRGFHFLLFGFFEISENYAGRITLLKYASIAKSIIYQKLLIMENTSNTDQRMLTGMFRDRESAESAYNSLSSRGYSHDDVNLMMSDETRKKHFVIKPLKVLVQVLQ
jgi:hypothetical protein